MDLHTDCLQFTLRKLLWELAFRIYGSLDKMLNCFEITSKRLKPQFQFTWCHTFLKYSSKFDRVQIILFIFPKNHLKFFEGAHWAQVEIGIWQRAVLCFQVQAARIPVFQDLDIVLPDHPLTLRISVSYKINPLFCLVVFLTWLPSPVLTVEENEYRGKGGDVEPFHLRSRLLSLGTCYNQLHLFPPATDPHQSGEMVAILERRVFLCPILNWGDLLPSNPEMYCCFITSFSLPISVFLAAVPDFL